MERDVVRPGVCNNTIALVNKWETVACALWQRMFWFVLHLK